MNLDLRIPMGLMFLIVGAILTVYGLLTMGSPIYAKSVGMNINLIWGVVMLVFGGSDVSAGAAFSGSPGSGDRGGRRGRWGAAATERVCRP